MYRIFSALVCFHLPVSWFSMLGSNKVGRRVSADAWFPFVDWFEEKKRRFAKTGRLYFECSQVLFYYRQPVYNWPKALWWPTAWLVWLLHLDSPELETTFYALCAAVYERDGWMWLYLQSNENWRWEVSSQAGAVNLARKQPTTIIWFLHIFDYCTFIELLVGSLQKNVKIQN